MLPQDLHVPALLLFERLSLDLVTHSDAGRRAAQAFLRMGSKNDAGSKTYVTPNRENG
jgi:hypothetical protein